MDFQPDLWTVGVALVSGGAAWGGSIAAQRSTKQQVQETKEALQKHTEADHSAQLDIVQRLASIEALLRESLDK